MFCFYNCLPFRVTTGFCFCFDNCLPFRVTTGFVFIIVSLFVYKLKFSSYGLYFVCFHLYSSEVSMFNSMVQSFIGNGVEIMRECLIHRDNTVQLTNLTRENQNFNTTRFALKRLFSTCVSYFYI